MSFERDTRYLPEDIRHWLRPDEQRVITAIVCSDLGVKIRTEVALPEDYRKSRSRRPLVEDRREREHRASDLLHDRAVSHRQGTIMGLLWRLAAEREQQVWPGRGTFLSPDMQSFSLEGPAPEPEPGDWDCRVETTP